MLARETRRKLSDPVSGSVPVGTMSFTRVGWAVTMGAASSSYARSRTAARCGPSKKERGAIKGVEWLERIGERSGGRWGQKAKKLVEQRIRHAGQPVTLAGNRGNRREWGHKEWDTIGGPCRWERGRSCSQCVKRLISRRKNIKNVTKMQCVF